MALILGSVRKIDNLDDRKQICIQLQKLSPEQRTQYLKWAVSMAPINIANKGKPQVTVTKDGGRLANPFPFGSVEQTYFDLMIAIQQFAVPVDVVLIELEKRASQRLIV